MFTKSDELREFQEIAGRMQALVRKQLIRDFIAHLEEEYQFATTRIDELERPSILVWLGQVGGYYAILQDRYRAVEQLNNTQSIIRGVFDWEDFVVQLDAALNTKYGEQTPARLIIEPAVRDENSPHLDWEILTFKYDPQYAWGD